MGGSATVDSGRVMSGFYAGGREDADNNYRQSVSLPAVVRILGGFSLLDHALELLAGVKGNDATRRAGNGLAGFGIASRARRLIAHLEIAETRQLHGIAARPGIADFFDESIHDPFCFALVQNKPPQQNRENDP